MEVIKFNLEKLEKRNTGFAYYILGRSYDLEENDAEQDYSKAVEYYQKGLELGDPLCMYSIGISYKFGLGYLLPVDEEKAEELLVEAYPKILEKIDDPKTSEVERVYAEFVTGAYHYFGLGNIKQDYNKAFEIIKDCADKGHIAAIYDLGANFYYKGNGTEKNEDLANYYLEIAKENGLPRAIKLSEKRKKLKI